MTSLLDLRVLTVLVLVSAFGCVTPTVWVAEPESQTRQNPYYSVVLEPLRENNRFFVRFRISVTNRTDKELKIDWNRTRYLQNGAPLGIFVFKGIDTSGIKNQSIPHDTVPPGQTFVKDVAPLRLLARAPLGRRGPEDAGIEPGVIPSGRAGMMLVAVQDGKVITEKIHFTIDEKPAP